MEAMGFQPTDAAQALVYTGNTGLEQAVNWLLEQGAEGGRGMAAALEVTGDTTASARFSAADAGISGILRHDAFAFPPRSSISGKALPFLILDLRTASIVAHVSSLLLFLELALLLAFLVNPSAFHSPQISRPCSTMRIPDVSLFFSSQAPARGGQGGRFYPQVGFH